MKALFKVTPLVQTREAESLFTEPEDSEDNDIVVTTQLGPIKDKEGNRIKYVDPKLADGDKKTRPLTKAVEKRKKFTGNDGVLKAQKVQGSRAEYPQAFGIKRQILAKDAGDGTQLVLGEADDHRRLFFYAEDSRVTPVTYEDAAAMFSDLVTGGNLTAFVMPFEVSEFAGGDEDAESAEA